MKSADLSNSRNVLFGDGQTFGLKVGIKSPEGLVLRQQSLRLY